MVKLKEIILGTNLGQNTVQEENLGVFRLLTNKFRGLVGSKLENQEPVNDIPKQYVNYNPISVATN